jgi:hypothetical protein
MERYHLVFALLREHQWDIHLRNTNPHAIRRRLLTDRMPNHVPDEGQGHAADHILPHLSQTSLLCRDGVPHKSLVAEILLQNLAEEHEEPIVLRYTLGQGQIGIKALMEGIVVYAAQFNVPALRTFNDLGGVTIPETKWNGSENNGRCPIARRVRNFGSSQTHVNG